MKLTRLKQCVSLLIPHEQRQSLKRQLFGHRDITTRLQTLRNAGFECTGAIDAGAYHGDWSAMLWSVFPGIPVWLVEPQPGCQEILNRLVTKHPGSRVIGCALSDQQATAAFLLGETNSGLTSTEECSGHVIEVPTMRLDTLLLEWEGVQPNLLKLDLQGHELQAVEGAGSKLAQFEVLILEVSLLRIGEVPIFHEVNACMEERGFRLYDIIPQYDRPRDGALWQVDAFFARHDSALITSRSWD